MGFRLPFGRTQRRSGNGGYPEYDFRLFLTTDARQNAFDDYQVLPTFQSGLAGLEPLWFVPAAQAPTGFDYTTNVIGYGGTPAPVINAAPLIDDPAFTQSFLANLSPAG